MLFGKKIMNAATAALSKEEDIAIVYWNVQCVPFKNYHKETTII